MATGAGMLLGIAPGAVGIGVLVWITCTMIWHYVSLASMVAAVVSAGVVWLPMFNKGLIVNISLTLLAGLVIVLHRANIKRLLNGTENRMGKKKETQE